MDSAALVQIRGIAKSYGGVRALEPLDLDLHAGEVHAICGENGAGKSTLNKILSGSVAPDSGTVRIDGKVLELGSVPRCEAAGIAIVHQESAAFLDLDATDNCQLMQEAGAWWLDRSEMEQRTRAALTAVGEDFNPRFPLESRSVAQRQMLAIARALARNCRVLILDEPTSSLSARESKSLFEVVRQLREKGVAIVYVSHRLDEIFELADRVTVLRDGHHVATKPVSETDADDLIQLMVGRAIEFVPRQPATPGDVVLQVEGLTTDTLRNVSFEVRAGEVVGLAGLVGAGRSEVARAIFGLDTAQGSIATPAPKSKVAFVPEDRQHEGLHLPLSIRDNLHLAGGLPRPMMIPRREEATTSASLIEQLAIKCGSDLDPTNSLSGGNQQKVLLGKWLAGEPKLLILDEPTRGVDVGAKDQIHRMIGELAQRGVAILLISSEMNEIIALSDRVLVMRQGAIVAELPRGEIAQEPILEHALPRDADEVQDGKQRLGVRREWVVAALLTAAIAVASIANPAFLSFENARDILVKVAPSLIVASFMTLLILSREIDISIGSLMGLCAAGLGIASSSDRLGLPMPAAVAICLGIGLVGGLFNGALTAYAKLPSIVVTLGTLTLFRAATEMAMAGKWIENMPPTLRTLGTGGLGDIPFIVFVAAAAASIAVWLSRRTRLGVRTFALGSNPEAARLVGIDGAKLKLALFALTGLAAGIATVFSAPQLQVVESGFGSGFELLAIAAVIVGGTSIRGGRGSVIGTILGALLLGIVSTVLIFLRLGESAAYWERAVHGGLILLAVLFDHVRRRKA